MVSVNLHYIRTKVDAKTRTDSTRAKAAFFTTE